MRVRPGYKQTEVGVIPEEWEVTHLGAHGATYGGLTGKTKTDFGTGEARFVPFMNVMPNVVIDCDAFERVHVAPSESQNCVLQHDLLFNGSSETPEEVALCSVQLAAIPNLFLNSFCFGYRLRDRARIDALFLAHLFRSRTGRKFVKALAQGSTRYNISKKALLTAPLSLPPLPEQRAIATVLSDVDALLGGLDRLIAKKRDLKQAATQQLLTGQTRLPGFHGEWEVKRLGELGATYGGLAGKSKGDFGHGDAQYIPFMNVMGNVVIDANFLERVDIKPRESQNRVQSGDLFFNGSSETPGEVGMCALLTEQIDNLYLNSFCFGFRLKTGADASGLYLTSFFRSRQGRDLLASLAQGSTRYNLSKRALLSVEYPCPTIEEQTAIADVLSDMDAELAALETRRDKTRDLKQAMMQELHTGKTRLVAVGGAPA